MWCGVVMALSRVVSIVPIAVTCMACLQQSTDILGGTSYHSLMCELVRLSGVCVSRWHVWCMRPLSPVIDSMGVTSCMSVFHKQVCMV